MGLFDIINIPMGYVIRFLNSIVNNQYLLALLLFAIFIEIILLPFGIKQQKNSIKQAKLRPKEMAIRKKYAGRDDNVTKQKVTQEIQELYQKEGYSPLSGCLPLLIQMPIMFALYYIVINPLRYICQFSTETIENLCKIVNSFGGDYEKISIAGNRSIELMNAIEKISESNPTAFNSVSEYVNFSGEFPNLTMFGINFADIPNVKEFNWILIVPVITFVVYFFSSKITRKLTYQPTTADDAATGCSNKMMDWMMPLMSVFISFAVPAAVGVYWIFKSIIGVIKQFILKKAMPIPTFTEEDYKAAEKEYGSKSEKANKSKSNENKPRVRSLHHIDDEDDIPELPSKPSKYDVEDEQVKNDSEQKKPSIIAEAPIKDDVKPARKSKKATKEEKKEEETSSSDDSNETENN